jgi:hypothetical protein
MSVRCNDSNVTVSPVGCARNLGQTLACGLLLKPGMEAQQTEACNTMEVVCVVWCCALQRDIASVGLRSS